MDKDIGTLCARAIAILIPNPYICFNSFEQNYESMKMLNYNLVYKLYVHKTFVYEGNVTSGYTVVHKLYSSCFELFDSDHIDSNAANYPIHFLSRFLLSY